METDFKYYTIHLVKDLFNDTVLVCDYGSKHNLFHSRQNIVVQSIDHGLKIATQKIKIRYRHGYRKVFMSPKLEDESALR